MCPPTNSNKDGISDLQDWGSPMNLPLEDITTIPESLDEIWDTLWRNAGTSCDEHSDSCSPLSQSHSGSITTEESPPQTLETSIFKEVKKVSTSSESHLPRFMPLKVMGLGPPPPELGKVVLSENNSSRENSLSCQVKEETMDDELSAWQKGSKMTDAVSNVKEESDDEMDYKKRLVCKVCGDSASGFHYRVATCEACKAFFKRTVQGNIDYLCPGNGNCRINIRGRKACQACRFDKCLRAGMLKEGVRSDRARGGRQKYYRRAHANPLIANGRNGFSAFPTTPLEENSLLTALKQGEWRKQLLAQHPATDNTTATAAVAAKHGLTVTKLEPEEIFDDTDLYSSQQLRVIMADLVNRHLSVIISSVKLIPGFTKLSLDDQLALVKNTWAEIFCLTVAHQSFGNDEDSLQFAPNLVVSRLQASQCDMGNFFQKCVNVVKRIKMFGGLKYEEYLLMKSLILVNADVQLGQEELVEEMKEETLAALNGCLVTLRSTIPMLQMPNMLLLLPATREANASFKEMLRQWREQIGLHNGLLLEMMSG